MCWEPAESSSRLASFVTVARLGSLTLRLRLPISTFSPRAARPKYAWTEPCETVISMSATCWAVTGGVAWTVVVCVVVVAADRPAAGRGRLPSACRRRRAARASVWGRGPDRRGRWSGRRRRGRARSVNNADASAAGQGQGWFSSPMLDSAVQGQRRVPTRLSGLLARRSAPAGPSRRCGTFVPCRRTAVDRQDRVEEFARPRRGHDELVGAVFDDGLQFGGDPRVR